MIDAKDAHYLTNEAITRNRFKVIDEVEKRINEAIDKGEFTITVDNIFLNDNCVEFLKENGYKLDYVSVPYQCTNGWIISW